MTQRPDLSQLSYAQKDQPPLARTAALLSDRYGISVSLASIQTFAQEAAGRPSAKLILKPAGVPCWSAVRS